MRTLYKIKDIQGARVMSESELAEFTEMICNDYEVESLDDADIECVEIKNPMDAENLDELLEIIKQWSDVADSEIYFKSASLPTFGGDEPKNTSGIWSWDETRLMTGECFSDFEIVER